MFTCTVIPFLLALYLSSPSQATRKTVKAAVRRKGDAAEPGQLNFQTPATEIMEKIVDLHHDLMFFIVVIVIFVS